MPGTRYSFQLVSSRARVRGVALMLVLTVIGLATVMGVAILASASLQSQVKSNSVAAAQAQYLAESGVNLAIYYLQHPNSAPTLVNGVYPGENGISFGAFVPGTVNVGVVPAGTDLYDIIANASAGPNGYNRINRQIVVRVMVNAEYQITHAAAVVGSFTVPALATITGDVRCDGTLSKISGATITGSVTANGVSNIASWSATPAFPTKAAPALAQITLYTQVSPGTPTYTYLDTNGVEQTGTADVLPATVSGTLGPRVANPKGVFYSNGNVTLGDCTINGTILMRRPNAALTIDGDAQVVAQSGMPGAIVAGNVEFQSNADAKSLTVDGLCWTGGDFTTTADGVALNCALNVNGALMMSSASAQISPKIVGAMQVTYQASKVKVPRFSTIDRTPASVRIVQWGD